MVFDNKPISEITEEDLTDLIGNQEENLWIDFKREHYHGYKTHPDIYRREICKDVTAMANADSEVGYILIGIDADNNNIARDFFDISDAKNKAKSIYDTCLQHIKPRIAKLEVESRSLEWQNQEYNLIIIHIPFSENRPHGFDSNGTLNFVRRYGEVTKEFDIEEFIPDLIKRHHLSPNDDIRKLLEDDIRGQLDRIENQTTDILKKIGEIE